MKDLTPDSMKCFAGSCPSVHEITPADLQCALAASCPSVHEIANSGDLIIVGKRLPPELQAQMAGKVGDDEYAVVISRALLANVLPQHLHFPPPKQAPNLPPSTLFQSNPKAPAPYEPFDGNYRDPQVMGDI